MVDFVNLAYPCGSPLASAIRDASKKRFRPIVLTAFVGIVPLLLEKRVEAQFRIPMDTSIAFGLLFFTFVVLLVLAAYYILEDVKFSWRRWVEGSAPEVAQEA